MRSNNSVISKPLIGVSYELCRFLVYYLSDCCLCRRRRPGKQNSRLSPEAGQQYGKNSGWSRRNHFYNCFGGVLGPSTNSKQFLGLQSGQSPYRKSTHEEDTSIKTYSYMDSCLNNVLCQYCITLNRRYKLTMNCK